MRKILFTLLFFGLTLTAKSQNASVEKSTFGIQTGILGIWVHNESKLSNQVVLRSEIGFDSGIWGGTFYDKTGFRLKKERRIDGNSGNFISLKTSFHPDWFVISNYDNLRIVSDISIVPTWGIRRNIGNHFTYETGFGVGYVYYFAKDAGFSENKSDVTVNLHLRIGYKF